MFKNNVLFTILYVCLDQRTTEGTAKVLMILTIIILPVIVVTGLYFLKKYLKTREYYIPDVMKLVSL